MHAVYCEQWYIQAVPTKSITLEKIFVSATAADGNTKLTVFFERMIQVIYAANYVAVGKCYILSVNCCISNHIPRT